MTDGPASGPTVDATLLPQFAWKMRWRDRLASEQMLQGALDTLDPEDNEALSSVLSRLAWHYRLTGHFEKAIETANRAADLVVGLDDTRRLACCHITIAAAHLDQAEIAESHAALTRSLLWIRGADVQNRLCRFHTLRACLHGFVGELRKAEAEIAQALDQARDEYQAVVHHDHAWLLIAAGQPGAAQAHVTEAASVAEWFQMGALQPGILLLQAACHRSAGAVEEAAALLERASALAEQSRSRRMHCAIRMEQAQCQFDLGDRTQAIAEARSSLEAIRQIGYRLLEPMMQNRLAAMLEATDQGPTG